MKIYIIIFVILIIQSCTLGTTGSAMNENIDSNLKEEIRIVDEKVIKAIVENNADDLKAMMSPKLLEKSGDDIGKMLEQLRGVVSTLNYNIVDQYYVQNSTTGLGNTVMSGIKGEEDYTIRYQALNKEMFLSLIVPKNGYDEFLITNIYGKYPNGWKLNILQFGRYTKNGKTAPQLYQKAKAEHKKGYLVDAVSSMFLSSEVLKPANKHWEYKKEDEFKAFYKRILEESKGKFEFPVTVLKVETNPKVCNIYPQLTKEGYFPVVEYLSQIDLKDSVQLRLENNQIHKEIGNTFKGIDKDKEYIIYKAFNQIPDGKTKVRTHGFVKKLKNN